MVWDTAIVSPRCLGLVYRRRARCGICFQRQIPQAVEDETSLRYLTPQVSVRTGTRSPAHRRNGPNKAPIAQRGAEMRPYPVRPSWRNPHKVGCFGGLCPSEHSTGEPSKQRLGSITKVGHPRLRALLVEMVWRMVQFQPDYEPIKGCGPETVSPSAPPKPIRQFSPLLRRSWRFDPALNRAHLLVSGYDGVPPEESLPAACKVRISLPWHVRSERLPSRRCRASG
jgi:Transposase IS116/IS110/IS902 family